MTIKVYLVGANGWGVRFNPEYRKLLEGWDVTMGQL